MKTRRHLLVVSPFDHQPTRTIERLRSVMPVALVVALSLFTLIGVSPVSAQFDWTDVNPNNSNFDSTDPDGATGGRVNGIGVDPVDNQVYYAATEWGGIYKTTDGGLTWGRLNAHNPNATWNVKVDPNNSNRVYATSSFDGRVNSLAGINISTNGGASWTHPNIPDPSGLCSSTSLAEHSAFGVAIDPDTPSDVYIGTRCGVAVSTDSGATWTRVEADATQDGSDGTVWDVVVHDNGTIDVCGNNGHFRSTNGGGSWTTGSGLPTGVCSIAVSPDEANVLFVTVGANIYESDDGGTTWTNLGTPDSRRQGRIPFVATNQRSDDGDDDRFDLWFGDVHLYRGKCISNPDGGGLRCPQAVTGPPGNSPPTDWAGPYTRSNGGHDDVGDIVFDSATSVDACPTIFSCDGGVYYNTKGASPGCQTPAWEQPNTTPHALWLWALAGNDNATATSEDLYFGVQDNGTFGATDGGASPPTWNNSMCCDGFDFAADNSNALYTMCCGGGRRNNLYLGNPGLVSSPQVNTYPTDGLLPGFIFPDIIDNFGQDQFVVITRNCTTFPNGIDDDGDGQIDEADEVRGCSGVNGGDGGIYITTDVTANPIVWTELGNATEPPTGGGGTGACAVKASLDGATPTFYVQAGTCDGRGQDRLWRFDGTNPGGSWTQVNLPAGRAGIFDVDPNDPERLFIAANSNPPRMMVSPNGGATWDNLPELDDLMTGSGDYLYLNSFGPTSSTNFSGYPQPSLVAFDAEDPNIMAAGGRDSGVFLSTDNGDDWVAISNPDSTGGSTPHLPQPWYAYFDHESPGGRDISLYVGTRGRGVWRVEFDQPPAADAGGPYETDEGVDQILDGSGSSAPSGNISYAWDLDDDGQFDDSTDVNPTFVFVGQDGVYTVKLKVTDGDSGLTDIDETTVTVYNVAPTVVFDPQDPEDEGAPLVVTGTVTDPGWLEDLTGTINWGDGSPTEDVGGVLENVRPDATLTFKVNHCYGDNGVYAVEVCGFDDDTSTCESTKVTINNVAPTVAVDAGQVKEINEGDIINVLANFSDPGWLDTYNSTIDWGYALWPPEAGLLNVTVQGSDCNDPDIGTVTGSKQFGDNDDGGGFTIAISVTDDDGGVGMDWFSLTVNNLDPTAVIDETDAIDVCGAPFFIAHAGEDVDFSAQSTDPGSDDLFLSWDWDDGPPSPDVTTDYLVGVPIPGNPDPLPSPEVSPRDVTDMKTHAFADACFYNVVFSALDDDLGTASDDTDVVITGNARIVRSAGYWSHNYRRKGRRFFDDEQLQCYLDIVDHMSSIFSEETDADSLDDAEEVLDPSHSNGDIRIQFDRQLLAVWLNFANGAIEHDELVDTDFDDVPDTALLEVLCAAEAVRPNPATPDSELENWKNVLEAINLMDSSGNSS
ncbi:MAG: hypothetical protein DRJ65_03105 [Acidobacteria bacterium]|nr:MAG: hypothetical protein DRJ65_03105 [Acidobacteriota bacterium]